VIFSSTLFSLLESIDIDDDEVSAEWCDDEEEENNKDCGSVFDLLVLKWGGMSTSRKYAKSMVRRLAAPSLINDLPNCFLREQEQEQADQQSIQLLIEKQNRSNIQALTTKRKSRKIKSMIL
jgi:hypothetical protein